MVPRRLVPWIVRVSWAVLPLTTGRAFAEALDPRSIPVRTAASVALWAAWATAMCASLVLAPVALTVLRMVAPAAVVAAGWALSEETGISGLIALATGVVAVTVVLLPETAESFVNGPAYPNERRFPLRVPTPLLFGPIVLAWALTIGSPAAAVLLVAAGQWVAGIAAGIIAVASGVVLGRALHGLSRRWVVFVPAGLVIHDPMSLADPVLFPKTKITAIDLAADDPTALDLTQRAAGLTLELVVNEKAALVLAGRGRGIGATVEADRIRFAPSRPGRVLAEFESRIR